ncbi:DEAD/DEAH box helicase family protein [Nocardiopsis sp. NRRL B-16309]|uniref:DEAD/DEAH box helicase family protein n=1 Tax=Nocardiopsis sp. NRRL B-16309 TaxID=1519494 RepID=UPI000A8CB117|nr:DEAD/DEAH box helicase [Nocardiopsis sp. NRRL B-16309]
MPLDLNRLGKSRKDPLLRPRDIYNASKKPWPYLRLEQGEVLDKWFQSEFRNQQDVVIKQNTGGGKTAIGLLIAQSSLNEGIGPAVYLTPDRYLAAQVRSEAEKLGFPTTDEPNDVLFRSGKSTLVTTFQKLINGQSVFGVVGDSREKISLGLVVIDDAHAALATTESQFRLTVDKSDESAYWPLIDLFETDLKEQSPKRWADLKTGDFTAALPVPFWAWSNRHQDVLNILHPYAQDVDFKFTWPLISEVLSICSATVTSRSIQISPPCPPVAMIPAFANAKRRVYLTATLADDSVLVTDLSANPDQVIHPITPGSAADLGDRIILAPSAINPGLDDTAVRQLARQFADGDRDGDGTVEARPVNVVVLVPSNKSAHAWNDYADLFLHAGNLNDGVAALKSGHVGLVVLSNKYDGIDLPDTACELLILDGAPRDMDATANREATVLSGSPTLLARQVQRIEQGMGRGVRDTGDHCAVLLMGSQLAVTLHDPDYLSKFSPATRAQIELSQDLTEQLAGQGLSAIREALSLCLDKDETWLGISRRGLAEVTYATTGSVRTESIATRKAFDFACTRRFEEACDELQQAIPLVQDPAMRGLVAEQRAAYLHHIDQNAAQSSLRKALDDNPHVLRPLGGVSPRTIRSAIVQAKESAEFLGQTYSNTTALLLGVKSIFEESFGVTRNDPRMQNAQ